MQKIYEEHRFGFQGEAPQTTIHFPLSNRIPRNQRWLLGVDVISSPQTVLSENVNFLNDGFRNLERAHEEHW